MRALSASMLGIVGLVGLAAVHQACNVYDRSLLLPPPPPEAGSPCVHARPPLPTPNVAPSGKPSISVTVAVSALDVGTRADAPVGTDGLPPFGYDLDDSCTCNPSPSSCTPRGGHETVCDDENGRDHAGLNVFRQLGAVAQRSFDTVQGNLTSGAYSLIIQLDDWDGTPNDGSVRVAVYLSNGVGAVQDGGVPSRKNDGTDRFTVDPRWVVNGQALVGRDCGQEVCAAQYRSSAAYVTNNVVVASLDTLLLSLGPNSGFGVLELTGSQVTGTLVPVALADGTTGYRIDDGIVAGRWSTAKLLSSLAYATDPLDPTAHLCGSSLSYNVLKNIVCKYADISSSASLDNHGPCDALSSGFMFKAQPAKLGAVYEVEVPEPGCQDGGVFWQDDCP